MSKDTTKSFLLTIDLLFYFRLIFTYWFFIIRK